MIYEYNRGDNPFLAYAKDIKFLDETIKFNDKLNIIVGPNGSGKTTLIESLAKLLSCEVQGFPKINLYDDLLNKISSTGEITFSDELKHNMYPVYFNKRYEKEFFDDSNFKDSLHSILAQNSSSAGELQIYEFRKISEFLKGAKLYPNMIKECKKKFNSYHVRKIEGYEKWLKKQMDLESCNYTLLLDEPTSNMDIANRNRFWEILNDMTLKNFQIIITAHDITPFLMDLDLNIIETEEGYCEKHINPYIQRSN